MASWLNITWWIPVVSKENMCELLCPCIYLIQLLVATFQENAGKYIFDLNLHTIMHLANSIHFLCHFISEETSEKTSDRQLFDT